MREVVTVAAVVKSSVTEETDVTNVVMAGTRTGGNLFGK